MYKRQLEAMSLRAFEIPFAAEKMQQCPEAYQKDKRLFGFVKDWASFIFDKAPFRACYCQSAIGRPKVLVKSVNAKHHLEPPDMHNSYLAKNVT